ncbi:MAG TPA: peptide ABC transporter substrate-binding protein [Bacillota bacterium]|nr:peptide ABC transporter substrate-binding protein [Bacillota bacterium]
MKKWFGIVFVVLAVSFLAACTANESAGEDDDANNEESEDNAEVQEESDDMEKVLYMNNGEEPSSFNPPVGFDSVSWNALNNLMEGLTRLGDDHTPEPAMAEDWDISDDGITYTFYIRDDANWSNEDPVTADDFVYAWTKLLDPETESPASFLAFLIENGEEFYNGDASADDLGLKAVDEKTFEVELNAPAGYFLHVVTNPAFFPVNKAVAEDNPDWHAEADSFIGNGPFELESWEHDDEFVMVKNDAYWDAESVHLDKIHWAMVNETTTEYQMFENGELDMSSIPAEMSDELIDDANTVIEDQGGLEFYRFNVMEEPFTNEKIRRALAFAVDREEMAEYVVKNGVEPAFGFVSPGFLNPSDEDFRDVNGDLVTFDPEAAKQLLEEGMEEEGYEELPEITLSYNTSEDNKAVAEALQGMFAENLDVEVSLENKEWNVFSEEQMDLELQFSRSSFLFDYADPINFLESFITDSSMNRTGWDNEEYNDLIAKAKTESDENARWEYMYEAEKLLAEEMPILPIRYYNQVVIQNPDISGIVRHPVGYIELKHADKN